MATCRTQGEGFVPYRWPEPGSSHSVQKLSFVKLFSPWGWVIGTGMYASEMQQPLDRLKLHLLIGTFGIVMLLVAATVWLAHHITLPLRHLAQFSSNLDLAAAAPVEGCRETRELAAALNATLQRLSHSTVSRDRLDAAYSFTRSVLDAIPMQILIVNAADKTIADANEFLARQEGKRREDFIGKTCHHIYWGRDKGCDDCCIETCRASGGMVSEEIRREVNGSTRFILALAAPVRTVDGAVTQVVHISQDITARKETEIALAQKNLELARALESVSAMQSRVVQTEKMATLGQVAAGVAHEINNPVGFVKSNIFAIERYLGKILSYLELLEKPQPSQEEVRRRRRELKIDYLVKDIPEVIRESLGGVERVENIVRNLKSFSRLDAAEMSDADINGCLDSTISIIWNEIKYKAELVRDYGELPQVTCFEQQLNQVFMNLLVNAAHAIQGSGTIRVSTWTDRAMVHIMVADDGCGIAPELQERIFDPFFTTKPAGEGTCLGLSISYDIVKKHGGDITLTSEVGRGAQFVVSIPIHPGAITGEVPVQVAV